MIHLYFGEGKGKTSAAVGLCVRALGQNIPVLFVQFLKSRESGEILMLEKWGATIIRGKGSKKFTKDMTDAELLEAKKKCAEHFEKAKELCKLAKKSENSSLVVVFDEICVALSANLLSENDVRDFLLSTPKNIEIVLTGRSAPPFLHDFSDYDTEFKKRKHPFDKGCVARKGIEF